MTMMQFIGEATFIAVIMFLTLVLYCVFGAIFEIIDRMNEK